MSLFSKIDADIKSILGSTALSVETMVLGGALSNALVFLDDLIDLGVTVLPVVVTDAQALEVKLAPAIAAAKADATGAEAALKELLTEIVAFVKARTSTKTASVAEGQVMTAAMIHIS